MASSLGSFYVTLGYRIIYFFYGNGRKNSNDRWYKILLSPSSCETCHKKIEPIFLVPVLGGVLTGFKCSICKKKFPTYYSLVELIFGSFFVFYLHQSKNLIYSLLMILFLGHVLISILTDSRKFILDYENLPFIILFGFGSQYFLNGKLPDLTNLYTGLSFLLFFFLISYLSNGRMGMGDVFYISCYAFLVSHPNWIFFLNSSYILALVFTFLLRKKNGNFLKQKIPMGVYYGISAILTLTLNLIFKIQLGD